ncbi:LOW QUALITY PROTEIN: hypothetical protein OSB04_025452 [Centaurea solstitialis]|uniref:Uncharacterized protein n=1 Tax=Centaurea solstitialis TaxID=347529 RepID=A0AA38SN38_9ASTR|nr:LOW QUALITY PROTEIN: hypothetical protein OSB04_025452 [Centaurea solstitialis]
MWKLAKNEMRDNFFGMPNHISLTCDRTTQIVKFIDSNSWQLFKHVITFERLGTPHYGELYIIKSVEFHLITLVIILVYVEKLKCALMPMLDETLFHKLKCALMPMLDETLFHTHGLTICRPILNKFRVMLHRKFSRGKGMHTTYRKHYKHRGLKALGHFDWTIFDGLYDILRDFKNVTTWLSNVYYPTSPLLLNELYIFSCKFLMYEHHQHWGTLIAQMKKKLLKYF